MTLREIELIVLDVDGTLTDGGVYYDSAGAEMKKFSIKDGCGIVLARTQGVRFMILTGRESPCVARRAEELQIEYVFQNVKDKAAFLGEFREKTGLRREALAYIGDDLNDLYAMREAGVTACPADAAPEVREKCDFILSAKGGHGAVREFIELLLKERGQWKEAITGAYG